MPTLTSAIANTVPITQFNRGFASKIFNDVKTNGAKVVMKNNSAECVLMSPEQYMALMDELNDVDSKLPAGSPGRIRKLRQGAAENDTKSH